MKRIIFLLFAALPLQFYSLHAQDPPRLLLDVGILAARNATLGLTYDQIKGSPHYSDAFLNSRVYLKDSNSASLPLRYDLYQDQIEFKKYEQTLWLTKSFIAYIQYGDEFIVPEPDSEQEGKLTFFFVKGKGKYSLYIRRKVSFHPEEPPKAYADPIPNRFERDNDEYYLKMEGELPVRIGNKKALLTLLSENEPALDFIKKSKIKAGKEDDLVLLVKFLNDQ